MPRSMDHCALPIELCERVIDALHCPGDDETPYSWCRWMRFISYPAWRRTSLVCYAWLQRSRFNLFYEVRLDKRSQVDLLLRTLSKTPCLADLILGLTIDPYPESWREAYVPFAHANLARLLRNCISLRLTTSLRWSNYPPQYSDLAFCHYQGRNITHFSVYITTTTCAAIFRLIRSLPVLRELVLDSCHYTDSQLHGPEALSKQLRRLPNSRKAHPLESLRSLTLGVCLSTRIMWLRKTQADGWGRNPSLP